MIFEITLKTVILLILVLILGVSASFSDIKNRLITNKLILISVIVGVVLNLTSNSLDLKINYLVNILFALFIGFLLWYINFWNAGDGKLFLAFTSLIPIELFFMSRTALYSYDVIVYTFVPVFFLFLIMLIFQTKKEELTHSLKNSFKPLVVINVLVAFFSFQWIINVINFHSGLKLNLFISAIILFFVFDSLEKLLRIRLIYLFYLTAMLRIIFDGSIYSTNFLLNFLFQIVIFYVFVYFFVNLAYYKFGTHVRIPDLIPGMNLCERIIKRGQKYVVVPEVKISLFMFIQEKVEEKSEIEMKPEGLSEKDIRKIQNWNKAGKIEVGSLLIQKRIPYAPFQFFGVIVLIILRLIGI